MLEQPKLSVLSKFIISEFPLFPSSTSKKHNDVQADHVSLQRRGLCKAIFRGIGYHIGSRQYVAHPNFFSISFLQQTPASSSLVLAKWTKPPTPPQELHQPRNFPVCSFGFHSALQESRSGSKEDQETKSETRINNSKDDTPQASQISIGGLHPTCSPSKPCLEEKFVPGMVVVWRLGTVRVRVLIGVLEGHGLRVGEME